MRAVIAVTFSIVLAALPLSVRAQQDARVATVALTGVRAKPEPSRGSITGQQTNREQKRTPHHAAKPVAKDKTAKLHKSAAAPHFNFEQRAARSFGPPSLTLPPDTPVDRSATQFRSRDIDRNQLAIPPSDPGTERITSAGIENMEKGNNHTFVVPLFQLLDKLSNQPPPE